MIVRRMVDAEVNELEVGTRRRQYVSTTITPGRNLEPSSSTRKRAIYPRCRVSRYSQQKYEFLERLAIRHTELGLISKQKFSLQGFISNTKIRIMHT